MEVKELASRWAWAALLLARVPSSLRGGQDARVPSSLRGGLLPRVPPSLPVDFSRSSRLIKQLHARNWVWLNIDMVHIIQPFVILTCQLIVSKRTSLATNVCASSQTGRFFYHVIYVPCHETMPSFMFLGDFFIYWDLKTEILIVSGGRQVCNSFSFLKRDLNMHPMTHVRFPTHFASLEHVVVVQIWIMDYIKCVENLVISNIYTMAKRTLNSFKFQPDTPVILCCM